MKHAGEKNQEIERLRAVAVLLVVVCHVSFFEPFLSLTWRQGWTGVDLFFVISGFVVSRSLFRLLPAFSSETNLLERLRQSQSALRTFFVRRFFRIFPLAFAWALLPLLAIRLFNDTGAFGEAKWFEIGRVLVSVFTLQFNYALITSSIPEVIPYYWSLSVEEHFYILLPIAFLFLPTSSRRLAGVTLGFFIICFLLRPFIPMPESWPENRQVHWYLMPSHLRFDSMLVGVALAILWSEKFFKKPLPSATNKMAGNAVTIVLLFLIWAIPTFATSSLIYHIGLPVVALISVVLVHMASLENNLVLGIRGLERPLEYVGSRSYGIYLIHSPIDHFMIETLHRYNLSEALPAWLQFTLWATLTLAIVELCHRFLEKPLIDYGRRFTTDTIPSTAKKAA